MKGFSRSTKIGFLLNIRLQTGNWDIRLIHTVSLCTGPLIRSLCKSSALHALQGSSMLGLFCEFLDVNDFMNVRTNSIFLSILNNVLLIFNLLGNRHFAPRIDQAYPRIVQADFPQLRHAFSSISSNLWLRCLAFNPLLWSARRRSVLITLKAHQRLRYILGRAQGPQST